MGDSMTRILERLLFVLLIVLWLPIDVMACDAARTEKKSTGTSPSSSSSGSSAKPDSIEKNNEGETSDQRDVQS